MALQLAERSGADMVEWCEIIGRAMARQSLGATWNAILAGATNRMEQQIAGECLASALRDEGDSALAASLVALTQNMEPTEVGKILSVAFEHLKDSDSSGMTGGSGKRSWRLA